jgi:putative hemolysin
VGTLASIGLVLLFVVVGGTFAAAEIALVSLREGQVKALAERGRRGRAVARLAADPNRYLAAVQIGVTLAGFLSAAFGAATLTDDLAPVLEDAGLSEGVAGAVALVGVTLVISYVSLVVGELAPKRLGLQRAEGVALATAATLDRIATLSRPVIWVLSRSASALVRLFGGDPSAGGAAISEEELRGLVAAHESLDADERRLIDEVFAAGEMQVREVMVPRTEVAFLDAGLTVTRAVKEAQAQPHSRYPVVRGSSDDIVGFVHVRDLMGAAGRRGVKLSDLAREVKMLPSTKPVLGALSEMRREGAHLAVVVDEYGGTAGIVTLEDLIEEVIGDIRDEYDVGDDQPRQLRGGDVEVDGLLNLEDFADRTGIPLPEGPYETVAGFIVKLLGHLPTVGEQVEVAGARLKVTSLDGRRVETVRVTMLEPPHGPGDRA